MLRTRFVAVSLAVTTVTAAGVVAAVRHAGSPKPTAPAVTLHNDSGVDPTYKNLTPGQKLDRALSLPGYHGVAEGVVASAGKSRSLSAPASDQHPSGPHAVVTDYAFTVQGFYGGHSPFATGNTVQLEVPGGTAADGSREVVEGAPSFTVGEHIFVFVTDTPPQTGVSGDPGTIGVTASSFYAQVLNGFAIWEGYTEDVNTFRHHFTDHPVPNTP